MGSAHLYHELRPVLQEHEVLQLADVLVQVGHQRDEHVGQHQDDRKVEEARQDDGDLQRRREAMSRVTADA